MFCESCGKKKDAEQLKGHYCSSQHENYAFLCKQCLDKHNWEFHREKMLEKIKLKDHEGDCPIHGKYDAPSGMACPYCEVERKDRQLGGCPR